MMASRQYLFNFENLSKLNVFRPSGPAHTTCYSESPPSSPPIITPIITPILRQRSAFTAGPRSYIDRPPSLTPYYHPSSTRPVRPAPTALVESSRQSDSHGQGMWGMWRDVWDECTSSTDEPEEMPKETPQETPHETPTEYNPEWDIDHIRKNGGL